MAGQVLRDYQQRGLAQILDAFRGGARSVLAVSPTGSGKTTLFGTLAARLQQPVVILVHRRELAKQAATRLREFGVPYGLIMAGEPATPTARVQIASVQTLSRRKTPPARLVIADEAHLSTAETWRAILEQYPDARVLGVTATPWRLSGKPLAGAYDACVVVAQPAELREQGHLCPYVGFSYQHPDLSGVDKVGDDYNQRQTGAAMSALVPTVVEQWLAHASSLSTVVFAATREHSQQLTAQFRAAGVAAEHLDGSTPTLQREAILRRVDLGVTRVLCNVGVAVEGLDIPRLKCCVLARPTLSLARAIQMMGRVRRPWQGVTARIHDHAFIIAQHGLPDTERDYTLGGKAEAPPALRTCKTCLALYEGDACPACGAVNEPVPRGERVGLQEVADAAQFEFSSETAALPAVPPRTVAVRWETPGRVLEGLFARRFVEQQSFGPRTIYEVTCARARYHLPGTAQLDRMMGRVAAGKTIRVTYQGERLVGDRARKEFKVEVDDAA
jgi:superfamily II DNA or RNA helicase